ncbi:DUF3068 domain-containing protein [Blastococcus sp. VKM Ac-2987]|uniref:DUF3068 domain-containing protein n=1 Tax=Blastococcus sp. VKM Ac-2987 TaxID=3004141 RepID=UPI0022ABB12C|nr:DUF3068 domain-containing protein [Blastococcus sp. VKM Ac-2987]MCZ2860378.1 DUF3068 domain-containing protein [Blastococcus sp. VKM Ac-2987]
MRGRAVSLSLIGLGAFLLAAAVAVRLVLAPDLVKLPLDQTAEPTAVASDLSWFSLADMEQVEGGTGTVAQRVQGDPADEAAGDDVAVWHVGTVISDSEGNQVNIGEYTACLDRKTAEGLSDCNTANIDGDYAAEPQGLTVTFPFGTEKRDYDVFNPTTGETFPARYVGEEELGGLTVYRFEQQIPETVVRTERVPGALAGSPDEASVEADFVYSNTRTLWVEPDSGVVVTAEEQPDTVVTGPDGTRGVTWFAADVAATDETIAAGVERAEDTRSQIMWVEVYGPIALAVLGLVLLIAGAVLGLRPRREPQHRYEPVEEQSHPVAEVR